MAVKSLRCPNCGGVIETFDETMKKGFCPFCDTLIEDIQERQAEMAKTTIDVDEKRETNTNKIKKSGIIRFVLAIVVLAVIIIYYICRSTLETNGEGLSSSSWPAVLCIALLLGVVVSLIIDLVYRKRNKTNVVFSICAVVISAVTLCSNFLLDFWSSNEFSYNRWIWEQNNSNFENKTTTPQKNKTTTPQKVELTAINATRYFDFNCYCDNLDTRIVGLYEYSATVSCHIVAVNKKNCSFEDVCISGKVTLGGVYWGMDFEGEDVNLYISADGTGEAIVTASIALAPTRPEIPSRIDFYVTQASGYITQN